MPTVHTPTIALAAILTLAWPRRAGMKVWPFGMLLRPGDDSRRPEVCAHLRRFGRAAAQRVNGAGAGVPRRGGAGLVVASGAPPHPLGAAQGFHIMLVDNLARLATLAAAGGQLEQAARLAGGTAALCEGLGIAVTAPTAADFEHAVARTRATLGDTRFAQAEAAGRRLPLASVVATTGVPPTEANPCPIRSGLSPREVEVLQLIAAGRSNREIAHALAISGRTVENHVRHILTKLDLPSRTAAATYAVRRGLA